MSKVEETNPLVEVKNIVSQCDRCGTCRLVCPLFEVKDMEVSCARGKVNIARALAEGGLEPTAEVLASMNFCLLCRACVDSCPSKIKTDEAMIAVRQHFANQCGGASAKYKLVGGMLKRPALIKLAGSAVGLMRRLGARRLAPAGMIPRKYTRENFLAAFAGPAALGQPAPGQGAMDVSKAKVGYFYGCGMRMFFPEIAKDTLEVLRAVTEPVELDNVCCGLPHLAHGMKEDFLALAKENIRRSEHVDVIVSDCASCSGTLKHIAAHLANDPEWRDRAREFSGKILDLAEYLVQAGYQPRQRCDARLTFHEPCHLGRGQGIRKQPRELLKAAGQYVEMTGADSCCGGAGSFHLDYPEIADAVLAKKQANIVKSGAQVVVTECPVCLLQMRKAADRSGGKFTALHISQVI